MNSVCSNKIPNSVDYTVTTTVSINISEIIPLLVMRSDVVYRGLHLIPFVISLTSTKYEELQKLRENGLVVDVVHGLMLDAVVTGIGLWWKSSRF